MTNKTLIQTLQEIANAPAASIEKYVATQALAYGENPEEFLKMILNYGCATGFVSGLVYYADTHKFFDTYYEEIEELRMECDYIIDLIKDRDLKNTLAWFAFEQVAYNLANKLEMEV
jgi:hypothetical protein